MSENDTFIPGVDWWAARYHGAEIFNPKEGMPIAVERTREEALRVATYRVTLAGSREGGEVSFRVADGRGESGDAIREIKGHVDEMFRRLEKKEK